MAKETYYAWSVFDIGTDEWGQVQSRIKPGEKITQEMIGVTDADWAELVEAGAVRTEPYPKVRSDLSPAEHTRDLDNKKETREIEMQRYMGPNALPPEHEPEESTIFDDELEEPETAPEVGSNALSKALGK